MEIIFYVLITVCYLVLLNVLKKQKQQLIEMDNRLKLQESFSIKCLKLFKENDVDFPEGGVKVG